MNEGAGVLLKNGRLLRRLEGTPPSKGGQAQ